MNVVRFFARLKALLDSRGAQLLELAIVVPTLGTMVVAIGDFGGAYVTKQKMTNAAREGARVAVSNALTNQNCSDATPCSMEAAADAIKQYLTNAGLDASCITPNSPSSSGNLTWTWECSNTMEIAINRGYTFEGKNGNTIPSTQITLYYPYNWIYGGFFGQSSQQSKHRLEGGSNSPGDHPYRQQNQMRHHQRFRDLVFPTPLSTTVVMENID